MKGKPTRENAQKQFWTHPAMNKAFETGFYYGFTPINLPAIEKTDLSAAKGYDTVESEKHHTGWMSIAPEEKISLLRTYFTKSPSQIPLMFMYERPHQDKKNPKNVEYGFEILGATKSIADATLIKTMYETCRDEHLEDIIVEVNSLGDRDSINRFGRDLTAHFRKMMHELDADCRHMLKKDPFAILHCTHEKCKAVKDSAPKPMNYLSEPSRIHFIELLETLEAANVPYTLNNNLVENRTFVTHTLFRILGKDKAGNQSIVACGARWSGIAKKIGLKKDVPSLSAIISIRKDTPSAKKVRMPECYFIHMGQEAIFKSLSLIESLREQKISVYHSLTKDKLTAQLMSAEYFKVPFILIMGQKESMDNTVLVRKMSNHSQDIVKLADVGDYLKKALEEM